MTGTFALLAALLLVLAVAAIVWPLWRAGATPRATQLAVLLGCALPLAAVFLYRGWSNYAWDQAQAAADTPQAMVARLARRLEKSPDDKAGWLQLGRSYLVLGQMQQSARAYQRADRLAGGQDAEALLGWAEALFRADEKEIEGRAGRLFERALALDPQSTKALLFAAIAAQRRGEWSLARERFVQVLNAGAPQELRAAIEEQINLLSRMDGAAAPAPQGSALDPKARVEVTVQLASALATPQLATAPLFVLARRAGEAGPPLAVKRLPATFPQSVVLTEADAMLPSRKLVAGEAVEVVARIALSGSPTAGKGDPFGVASYRVGTDGRIDLRIDKITP